MAIFRFCKGQTLFKLQAIILVGLAVLGVIGCDSKPTSLPPVAVSVVAESGSGAEQLFDIKFSQPGGYRQLSDVRLLINSRVDGGHACYVYYDLPSNSFLLVNDSGSGTKPAMLGKDETVENGQCEVTTKGASVGGHGDELVKIPIHFKPVFAGMKKLILYAENVTGKNTDLVPTGSYNVTE